MIARYNFADYMITRSSVMPGEAGLTPIHTAIPKKLKKTLAHLLDPFTQLDLGPDVIARLRSYMQTDFQGNPLDWDPANHPGVCAEKAFNLPRLLMSLPEFHLN